MLEYFKFIWQHELKLQIRWIMNMLLRVNFKFHGTMELWNLFFFTRLSKQTNSKAIHTRNIQSEEKRWVTNVVRATNREGEKGRGTSIGRVNSFSDEADGRRKPVDIVYWTEKERAFRYTISRTIRGCCKNRIVTVPTLLNWWSHQELVRRRLISWLTV